MTKTKKELEQRVVELEERLRKQNPLRQYWNRCKPYFIPFILGMILGGAAVSLLPSAFSKLPSPTLLEKQAASGGAVIPFPNESPSPNPLTSPQGNSKTEPTASSWMNTFGLPLQSNPQADGGQTISTAPSRTFIRRIR